MHSTRSSRVYRSLTASFGTPTTACRSLAIDRRASPSSICADLHAARRQTFLPRSRKYYTSTSPTPPPYPPLQAAILSAAHARVPDSGFSLESLKLGAIDAGYLPATCNLFTRGSFDLVLYHLVTERLALKGRLDLSTLGSPDKPAGTGLKVRALLLARLRANANIIHKLPEALGHLSLLGNTPTSVAELARLVDEIWYLSGDKSVDNSWYTKRGMLAGVYAASEMFMTQDKSANFKDTEEFVDRRLEDVQKIGSITGAVLQWYGFTGLATVNVLRSWGARI